MKESSNCLSTRKHEDLGVQVEEKERDFKAGEKEPSPGGKTLRQPTGQAGADGPGITRKGNKASEVGR